VGNSDRLSLPSTPHNEMKALTLTTIQVPNETLKRDVVTHGIFSNMCFCIDMESSDEFQRKVSSHFFLDAQKEPQSGN
jgi:N-acetyl-anhydromuramyl-L-alanine amidase AmpD